jgi:hypothetical protein
MLRNGPVIACVLLVCALAGFAQERTYKMGDRVEAHDISWDKGTVTEIGAGKQLGSYMVKYDKFATMRWFAAKDLRPGGPPDPPKIYPAYSLGDRIEAYDFGWHTGIVTQLGSGANQGSYLVRYDKFSTSRWFQPKDLRSAAVAASEKAEKERLAATATLGPRLGKYNIYSYGAPGTVRLYLGHVEILAGQKYRVSRTSEGNYFGDGTFTFDSAGRKIQWTSGPYAIPEWGGGFSVDGSEHRITLRRGTIAVNASR